MTMTYGFAPAPLYAICLKGYFNFFVALILLLGCKTCMRGLFPRAFEPERFNAHTGEKSQRSEGRSLLSNHDESDVGIYKCPLSAGDWISFPDGYQGHVFCVRDRDAAAEMLLSDSGLSRVFDSDPECRMVGIGETGGGILLSGKGEVLAVTRDSEGKNDVPVEAGDNLSNAYIDKTARSKMLAPIKLKATSLLFQACGIISTGYSIYVLSVAVEMKTWSDFKLVAFLFSQHSSAITLTVATAQIAIFASYSSGDGERKVWSALFLICCILCFPCAVGVIAICWYGFLVYCVAPFLLGIALVLLGGTLLAFFGDPLRLVQGPGTNQYANDLPVEFLKGRRGKDHYDSYHSKGLLRKGFLQVVVFLPASAAHNGFTLFLIVTYVLIMLLAVPLAWILICGFAALPASFAILLEAIIPLLLLMFAAAKVAYTSADLLGRSGPSMILVFALSQLLIVFVSLLVPASILAQEADFGIRDALPFAYSHRRRATYVKAILNSVDSTLSTGQEAFEELDLANSTIEKTKVAISQLVALLA